MINQAPYKIGSKMILNGTIEKNGKPGFKLFVAFP
jgi:hypothetical protein